MQEDNSQLTGLALALCVIGAMWGIIAAVGLLIGA
jgi:hypothetical protein